MITYLVTREGEHAIRDLPSVTIGPAAAHFEIVTYEHAVLRSDWHAGTVIFSDLERFWATQFSEITELHRRLAASGQVHLIHHPVRMLKRYGLLRRLREMGWNSFDVYRADEQRKPAQFPVFLHGERDHRGPITDLLRSQAHLDRILTKLANDGYAPGLVLITEFCDTRSTDGLFRKYGAYIIGDRIIPRHLYFSTHWNVKDFRAGIPAEIEESALFAEELDYLHGNPHETLLRPIFELAGVRYGRIDYGLRDGRLEVWEINTNPVHMVIEVQPGNPRYDEIFVPFNDRMHKALMSLPGASSREKFRIEPVRKQHRPRMPSPASAGD